MSVQWKLSSYLKAHKISVRQVMIETGLSSNTLYPIARGQTKQVNLETVSQVIEAISRLTASPVGVSDLLEYVADGTEGATKNAKGKVRE
jgi:DNA-binding Xre family transcriptional regulator